ncbi:MAG: mannose-1-phosphate guanylyltransferase [Anaerolineae bacterium]|nr:mannose-1-phosphate guanylyltransferase [Anaerolineae bacterium]
MPPAKGGLNERLYVVILAGGVGTRLWPRSRRRCPKQLLDIVDRRTMLQNTVDRVAPLVPAERICVVTGREYAAQVREQLPDLPAANILVEPSGRGTAPSVGLGAVAVSHADPQATIISLHADHVIADASRFRELLLVAAEVAAAGHLVTLGIRPTYPETAYGYIERGRLARRIRGVSVFGVSRFIEKPPAEQAAVFVRSGRYSWNSGMFVWRVDTILQAMQQWLPDLGEQLGRISAAWGTSAQESVLAEAWESVPSVSIDVGIMERATQVAVVPADIGWSDVGSWASLADLMATRSGGNVVLGEGEHLDLDTEDSLIYAPGRTVATIGLRGLIVVDTGDVLLVCPKSRAQDVRQLVEKLRQTGRQDLL